jgi:hypothetical protein
MQNLMALRITFGILCRRFRLVARLQRPRDRFNDIAADERFAEHIDHPCGPRAFAQLRTAVAA